MGRLIMILNNQLINSIVQKYFLTVYLLNDRDFGGGGVGVWKRWFFILFTKSHH